MDIKNIDMRSWPTDTTSAIGLQQELAQKVLLTDDFSRIDIIAGVDVSYNLRSNTSRAVVVTMRLKELQPIHTIIAQLPTLFPYIPGLLSFREIPVIIEALKQLPVTPDLLMVDGQGIAHPRRLGIAAHLGVLTNLPAIGVAKSRLTGRYHEPGPHKGDQTALMHGNTRIGTVLRSKDNANPLFISPGHRISHETALKITQQCITRYRLPEPTRIADKLSKAPPESLPLF